MRGRELAVLGSVAVGLVASAVLVRVSDDAAESRVAADWRGIYDILVLPAEGGATDAAEVSDASGLALVDPNFANVTSARISDDLVRAVRGMDDVEVAAPVGFLGRTESEMEWPIIHLPEEVLREEPLLAFRAVATTVIDDGLGEHVAQHSEITFFVDAREYVETGDVDGVTTIGTRQFDGGDRVVDGVVTLTLFPLPSASTMVFAVDPAAEMELLGTSGAFLEPLAAFDDAVAAHGGTVTVTEYEALPDDDALVSLVGDLPEDAVQAGLVHGMYGLHNPIAPFLRGTDSLPPHELAVELLVGETPSEATPAELERLRRGAFSSVGTTGLELADLRVPFSGTSLPVPWPGHEAGPPNYFPTVPGTTGISPLSLTPSDRQAPSAHRPALQALRTDVVNATLDPLVPHQGLGTGVALGQTSAYRVAFAQIWPQVGLLCNVYAGCTETSGAVPLQVGQYTAGAVVPTVGEPGYVPMGAYDPARVEVVDNPMTPAVGDRAELAPTLTGLGLSAQPAGVVTSMAGAEAFGMADPSSAIRVRVAGIEEYSAAALARVDAVARQIEELGLTAHVVAGASPQDVQVYVPDFAFGTTDPDGLQEVADLGWVELSFTTLGAGPAAHDALGGSAGNLAVVTVLVMAGAATTAIVTAHPSRAARSTVLRRTGFTTARRAGWFVSDHASGLLTLVAASAAAAVIAPTAGLTITGVAAPAALTLVVLAAALAAARAGGPTVAPARAAAPPISPGPSPSSSPPSTSLASSPPTTSAASSTPTTSPASTPPTTSASTPPTASPHPGRAGTVPAAGSPDPAPVPAPSPGAARPVRTPTLVHLAAAGVRSRALPVLVESAGVTLLAVAAAAAVVVVGDIRARVAATAIGEQAVIATSILSALLLGLCALGGLVTLLAGAQLDAAARGRRSRVLRRAVGLGQGRLTALEVLQSLPAALVVALGIWAAHPLVSRLVPDADPVPRFLVLAGGIALAVLTALVLGRSRSGRSTDR